MKKILTILLLLAFLIGCQPGEKQEYYDKALPPPPPTPGGQAVARAGLAIGIPPWSVQAQNVALSSKECFADKTITMNIAGHDLIYNKAYFHNKKTNKWEPIVLFGGETVGDWIKGSAVGNIKASLDKFDYGENHIVVYACKKLGSKWLCNNNKWMITGFNLKEKPAGAAPAGQNIGKMVINKNIEPFILQNTLSEEDNFEEILVMRYDAEYIFPDSGLKVKAMVFDVPSKGDLNKAMNTMFKDIVNKGFKEHKGSSIAVYLDVENARNAMWTSGKKLIFVQTFTAEFANSEIINAYLAKYPSDLKKV